MIFLLTFLYLIFLIKNYKKTLTFLTIWYPWFAQFSFPISGLNFVSACSFVTTIFFFTRERVSFNMIKHFPMKKSYCFVAASFILSNFLSADRHDAYMLSQIFCSLILGYSFWYLLVREPQKITRYVIRYSLILAAVVAFYSLFETISRTNPYIDFVNALDLYSNNRFIDEIRFGVKRTQSIFSMHTTSGSVCLLMFTLLAYLKYYYGFVFFKKWDKLLIPALLISTFLCGARSAIVGAIVVCFVFFSKKILKPKIFIPLLLLSIIGSFYLVEYLFQVYNSIINSNAGGGSSLDMRTTQFEIAFYYLYKNLIFGNGLAFTWNVALAKFKELLGAESLWIPIMIDQGLFGCFAYILLIWDNIRYVLKNNQKRLIFFILGMWIFNTMSSIPGFEITHVFLFTLILVEAPKCQKRFY